ncbi:MAG: hypothetical protein B6229_03830 [Spirochaetaceae bacterium 4572_7]|nr:MAG: hypothetical protein B6229_03830 [Spirochaetaceae bacterium 4572_7]
MKLGESTTIQVTATGDIDRLQYTEPKNISITSFGQSSSIQIVNGKKTQSYSFSYRVTPKIPGTLKLPIFFTQNSQGEKIESEQLSLYVDEKIEQKSSINADYTVFETEHVKLFMEIPQRKLYVGEAIPVLITAYFSSKYQPGIERSPYMKTGSFIIDTGANYTNNNPDIYIDNERWIQITWNSYLTPLKPGLQNIEVQMDSYIEKSSGNSGFFSRAEKEPITTSTKLQEITITPLPLENRPETFTGAVGTFSMESSTSTNKSNVGDPITYSINIYGQGNFKRVNIPKINDNKNWKIYPETSTFNGSNDSQYHGVKNFEQIISPKNDKITAIPPFIFTYFDPEKGSYIDISTETFPIEISPGVFQNNKEAIQLDTTNINRKPMFKHQKSTPSTVFIPISETYIFKIILFASLLLLIASTIIYIMNMKKEFGKNNINKRKKELLNRLNSLEKSENYTDALITIKNILLDDICKDTNKNPESITSTDLIENPSYYNFFVKTEEIKYRKVTIKKSEYETIKDAIKLELEI